MLSLSLSFPNHSRKVTPLFFTWEAFGPMVRAADTFLEEAADPGHTFSRVLLVLVPPDNSREAPGDQDFLGYGDPGQVPTEKKFPATPWSQINKGETARLLRSPTNYQIPKPRSRGCPL